MRGPVSKLILLLVLCCGTPSIIQAQQGSPQTLREALLELAASYEYSIIIPEYLDLDETVDAPSESSLEESLDRLLAGTPIYYSLQSGQILLSIKWTLQGFIYSADGSEPLIGATVYDTHSGSYALTTEDGYFALGMRSDTGLLHISYVGYKELHPRVRRSDPSEVITFRLIPDGSLSEVLVTDYISPAEGIDWIEAEYGSDIAIRASGAVSMVGGEPDIFQAIIRQEGINASTEGLGGIHVRGGRNDQNLFLYDGVPLYHTAHAFGIYSTINNQSIDQARLIKSGARSGMSGRLSGILDIKSRSPRKDRVSGAAQVTSLATQAMIGIPIVKDRVALSVSGRRTHLDPLIKSLSRSEKMEDQESGETDYHFYDIGLRMDAILSPRQRVYFSLYDAADRYQDSTLIDDTIDGAKIFYSEDVLDLKWRNSLASIRLNSIWGEQLYSDLQLSVYRYRYGYSSRYEVDDLQDIEPYYDVYIGDYTGTTEQRRISYQLNYLADPVTCRLGINYSYRKYNLGEGIVFGPEGGSPSSVPIRDLEGTPLSITGYSNHEWTASASVSRRMSPRSMILAGAFLTATRSYDGDVAIATRYIPHGYAELKSKLSDRWLLGGSVGSYIQTEHLLTFGDNGYPNDIWVPSTDFIPHQRSNQLELYVHRTTPGHALRMAGYLKRQMGLILYDADFGLPSLSDILAETWESTISIGNAWAYGLELGYTYSNDRGWKWRMAYTLAASRYSFADINAGEAFPYDYSIPHTLTMVSTVPLGSRWSLAIDWHASAGKRYTPFETGREYSPLEIGGRETATAIGNINSLRLPASHKLSVAINRSWEWGAWKGLLSVGVQNLYNRKNIIYQYQLDGVTRRQTGFPILPSFRFSMAY